MIHRLHDTCNNLFFFWRPRQDDFISSLDQAVGYIGKFAGRPKPPEESTTVAMRRSGSGVFCLSMSS